MDALRFFSVLRLLPPFAAAAGLAAAEPAAGRAAREPLPVAVLTLVAEPLVERVSATGTLRADEAVELQAEAAGKVVHIGFTEGAAVREGELLLKINDADLQANLERAHQRRVLAEIKEQRLRTLVASGSVNRQDYDAAVSELRVQAAEVQAIRAQIAKTEVRAPFAGTAGLREVSVGAYVTPATRIATLQKLDGMKLDFALPERHLDRVRSGAAVTFRVSENPRVYTAEVYAVDPRIDLATRTGLLRARCTNADGRLLPGAFARIEVALGRTAAALVLPATAIVAGGGEKAVFVVESGLAQRRRIETGRREGGRVEVVAGLQAGEVVIVEGLQQVRPGMPVAALETN